MDKSINHSRIPREELHEQNERLSSKHIQTLSFLKELAEENKQLKIRVKQLELEQEKCDEFHSLAEQSKDRIKELQVEYLNRADEIKSALTENHTAEMMLVVGEKLDQEKYYLQEMVKMKDEIDELERMNQSLLSQSKDLNQADDQLPIALSRVEQYEIEIEKCREEKRELREELSDKISQLQELLSFKTNHENIYHDLQEAKQKNTELQFRITQLQRDLKDAEGDKEEQGMVRQLKIKLEKVLKERDLKSDMVKEQSILIENLKEKIEQLKHSLVKNEQDKERITRENHDNTTQLEYLKKQLLKSKDGSSFKEFVSLKREIKTLKYQNEDLRQVIFSTSSTSLPYLKTKTEGSNKHNPSKSKPSSATLPSKTKLQSISYH